MDRLMRVNHFLITNMKKNRETIDKLVQSLRRPFPAELPGTDSKADFDLEDGRIAGLASKFLKGKRIDIIKPFDPVLKAIIINYVPEDKHAVRAYNESLRRISELEEIVNLVNQELGNCF